LATASGDGTVKLWSFSKSKCVATYTEHSQAVWACTFHDGGDFLVSGSMDHTCKLWDVNTGRCRMSLRGHVDSVNSVCFQPFSNNICSSSGDKTVSLWDSRSGLCIQTLYGHSNSCNNAAFNLRGDTIASSDADGGVRVWDIRMVQQRLHIDAGPLPANKCPPHFQVSFRSASLTVCRCCFDRSGTRLLVASDDKTIRVYNSEDGTMLGR
jgi:WD40 repeat protein